MKKGITPIIAIVLLLMMTVAAFGMTFVWVQKTQGDIQTSVTGDIQNIIKQTSTCMSIDAMNFNKVYLRNCGKGVLSNSSLQIYVNGRPANYILDGDIAEKEVKEVEIAFSDLQDSNTISFQSGSGELSESITKTDIKNDIDSDSSLVGYWTFDEGSGTIARDSSGNGNDGNIIDDEGDQWVANAIKFDGVNDDINMGNASSFAHPYETALTAWIKPIELGVFQRIVSKPYQYEMAINSFNNLEFRAKIGGSGYTEKTVETISKDVWTHVGLIFDGTDMIFHINGVKVKEVSHPGIMNTDIRFLSIGSSLGTNYHFNGTIDEISVWNRALSPEEIKTLYEVGA